MSSTRPTTYGFIGLGLMGSPMCSNLAQKSALGDRIRVFDVNQEAVDHLTSKHPGKVAPCSSSHDVAKISDVIFTMLPEGRHVESVYCSEDTGLLYTSLDNKLLIDCSTIDPTTSLSVRDRVERAFPTAHFYDSPVSGGVIGAVKGTISFFVGCEETDPNLARIRPCLQLMGKQVIACGGPSLGLTAKLCNNYLSGILTIACSETFNIGMRAGMDPRKLYEVLGAGSAQNTICDKFCPVPHVDPESPSSHDYAGGFRMSLMLKDFTLASQMADHAGAPRIFGREALKMYGEVSALQEYRDLDVRAMFRYIGGVENWQAESL